MSILYIYLAALLTITSCIFYYIKDSLIFIKDGKEAVKILTISIPITLYGFLLIGLKPWSAGGDTSVYVNAFLRVNSIFGAYTEASFGTEVLFWPLQATLKYIFGPNLFFEVHFLLTCILTIFAYNSLCMPRRNIEHYQYYSISIFALLYLTFYSVYNANIMRQSYATPLAIMACVSYLRRKHIRAAILLSLAIGFHWSALIAVLFPIFTKLFNKKYIYIVIPSAFIAVSAISPTVAYYLVRTLNLDWLNSRSYYYLEGGRISHINALFNTANFWICSFLYFTAIILTNKEKLSANSFMPVALFFFSIVCFFSINPDISERYMVYLIFITPLLLSAIFLELPIPKIAKNIGYIYILIVIALLVIHRESTIDVLGLTKRDW